MEYLNVRINFRSHGEPRSDREKEIVRLQLRRKVEQKRRLIRLLTGEEEAKIGLVKGTDGEVYGIQVIENPSK